MYKPLPALLMILCLAVAGCATADPAVDFAACGVRPRVTVPVKTTRNQPTIQVTIADAPATMVLDTGASGIVLTYSAVRRLKLKSDPYRVAGSAGAGGSTQMFPAKLLDVDLAGLKIPDHSVSVLRNSALENSPNPPDGLFGLSVLSKFELDLDLPHDRLTLNAGRLCPSTVLPPWTTRYATLQARIVNPGGWFVVPIVLEGRVVTALIDTGNQITVVARDAAIAAGVTEAMLARDPAGTISGVGPNVVTSRLHQFGLVKIGEEDFVGQTLLVADRFIPGVDVILGMDYIANHHFWISYATGRVFVEAKGP